MAPEIAAVGAANVEMIFCSVSVHPPASVTVTVKVPLDTLMEGVIAPLLQA